MTTPSSPDNRPPQDANDTEDSAREREVSATPVVIDLDDLDDDLGGRAALDLDAPARRGARGAAGRPLDLSSLIGQFEAELQQQRARREPAVEQQPSDPDASSMPGEPAPTLTPASNDAESARLRQELDAERLNVRRAQADLVNARRKAEQERGRAVQDASERVIRQFFPLFDDFERGLASTRESRSYDQLAVGVEAILRNADALLTRYGVEPVQALGQLFDPTLHEAVGVIETEGEPEETVMQELRKGYTLGGRLLRAAMVRVARRPGGGNDATGAAEGEPRGEGDQEAAAEGLTEIEP